MISKGDRVKLNTDILEPKAGWGSEELKNNKEKARGKVVSKRMSSIYGRVYSYYIRWDKYYEGKWRGYDNEIMLANKAKEKISENYDI